MRSTAMWSANAVVPTRKEPAFAMSCNVSSVASEPCSMQSTPARTQARMPASPWAWAATRRPLRWASSTMASNSSVWYCALAGTTTAELKDMTPPEAEILISLAPYLIW